MAVALGVVIAVVLGRGGAKRAIVGASSGSATASTRTHVGAPFAPAGPALPGVPDGLRYGGVIVDGVGVAVVGAFVTAAREADDVTVGTAAATLADGRFVVAGLVPGRYRIRVTGAGLVAAQLRFVQIPADETRIVVARQVRIDGAVVDGTTPVANATVGLRGDAIGGSIETHTDAGGGFHFPDLPEGRYQVFAWKAALVARATRVPRLGAGPFLPVQLHVEAGAIVVGRVVDRDEGTGLLAAVELRPSTADDVPRYARTGDDGVFRIEGIPHGTWIADAYAPGYTSPGGIELEAGVGIPELALAGGATLEGRVLDAAGQPLSGASVRALAGSAAVTEHSAAVERDQLRRYSGWTTAPTAVAGEATFANDPQLLARGELGVLVGGIPPIPPPGATVATAATLAPAGGLDPSMVGLAAEPPPLGTNPARASIWITAADGRYRISGLPRGKVAALATLVGLAEGRSRAITVEPGQLVTGVDVVLAAGTMVSGVVRDQHRVPVAGATVHAAPEVGAALDSFTDASGTYRLGPLDGTVEVTASAYGHTSARRSLALAPVMGTRPAERTESFVLEVADAIVTGLLADAAGATVAAATIEIVGGPADGRRAIVAADGTFSIDMLPAGPVRVRVRHPAYPVAILDAVATIRGASPSRLRLPLGGAVEGVVLDADSGEPVAGLALAATGPGGAVADAATDKTGQWHLGPLAPGGWKITIQRPGYLVATRTVQVPVATAPGITSVRDVRIDLGRGALLAGTVRDGRGQRMAGATVVAQRVDGTGSRAEAISNSQGEFRMRDVPTGDLDITVTRGQTGGSLRVTVRPADELLTLELSVR